MSARLGRPPKYDNVEELSKCIDAYFDECDEKKEPYTFCGLAVALGIDRRTLCNYSQHDNVDFFPTVKRAKEIIQASMETGLVNGKYNSAGAIFSLKNNYDWRDRIDNNVEANISSENKVLLKSYLDEVKK